MKKLAVLLGLMSCGLVTNLASAQVRDPLGPWEVLGPDYQATDPLDLASYEWEYFTIQNEDDSFVGIIGYVIADPRGSGASSGLALVPAGGNIAVAGMRPGQSASAEFLTYGLANTFASTTEKVMYVNNPASGNFANIEPAPGATSADPALALTGRSDNYEWDLVVTPDFEEYLPLKEVGPDAAFSAVRGDDVGLLAGENWTVDAVWPRTHVQGTMIERATGHVIPINARGYRENSFGRYLLSLDGWDFAVFSDTQKRVQTMFQTYHRSTTIDYFDIAFPGENGQPQNVRFRPSRGELGWYHPKWTFDGRAKQCVPEKTWMIADNGQYRVELSVDMGASASVPYAPFLDNSTIGTTVFFIMEQFPTLNGVIRRADNGKVITTFAGRAGGEFAFHKSLFSNRTDFGCWLSFAPVYQHAFPN
ncbi:MAG: hypothetical protein R3B07_03375 [Polyangiaceae bacterium]